MNFFLLHTYGVCQFENLHVQNAQKCNEHIKSEFVPFATAHFHHRYRDNKKMLNNIYRVIAKKSTDDSQYTYRIQNDLSNF